MMINDEGTDQAQNGAASHLERSANSNAIRNQYDQTRTLRSQYQQGTEAIRSEFIGKLSVLVQERKDARALASLHAGNIGLIYHAKTNTFARVVIMDDLPEYLGRPTYEGPEPADSGKYLDDDIIEAEFSEDSAGLSEGETTPSEPQKGQAPHEHVNEVPRRPEAPARPKPPPPGPLDATWKKHSNWKSGFAWFFAVFIGCFVGFGLLKVTGLPYQRGADVFNFVLFMLLGVGTIGGMKLAFDAKWYEYGRQRALGSLTQSYSFLCFGLSATFVAVEAFLGGFALVKYTEAASFENKGGEPILLMTILALAVSFPNLTYSGYIAFQKGQRSLTDEDLLRRQYELELADHHKTIAELEGIHEERLQAWRQIEARKDELSKKLHDQSLAALDDRQVAHTEALERWRSSLTTTTDSHDTGLADRENRVSTMESYKREPDYQALCQAIGMVETLSVQIEEVRRAYTNEMISRGYGKQTVI